MGSPGVSGHQGLAGHLLTPQGRHGVGAAGTGASIPWGPFCASVDLPPAVGAVIPFSLFTWLRRAPSPAVSAISELKDSQQTAGRPPRGANSQVPRQTTAEGPGRHASTPGLGSSPLPSVLLPPPEAGWPLGVPNICSLVLFTRILSLECLSVRHSLDLLPGALLPPPCSLLPSP